MYLKDMYDQANKDIAAMRQIHALMDDPHNYESTFTLLTKIAKIVRETGREFTDPTTQSEKDHKYDALFGKPNEENNA